MKVRNITAILAILEEPCDLKAAPCAVVCGHFEGTVDLQRGKRQSALEPCVTPRHNVCAMALPLPHDALSKHDFERREDYDKSMPRACTENWSLFPVV